MKEREGRSEPYHYVELGQLSVSTTDASYEFERKPDKIKVHNTHASNAVYITFDKVATTSNGYAVPAGGEREFVLDARTVHAVVSTSTATLCICGLAYEDVRLKA